jgi:hypothetical protein
MSIGKTVCILGLSVLVGAGSGYSVYVLNNRPEQRRMEVGSVAEELNHMRQTRPEKYLAAKQYVIDDIVNNPYDNIPHIRRVVEKGIESDQKETLKTMLRFYGDEVKGILSRRIE